MIQSLIMEKLLITGINGTVGYQLYEYFKVDYEVWGLDLRNFKKIPNFIESDVTDFNRINKDLKSLTFDYVIHLAAIAHLDRGKYSIFEVKNVNVNGTSNLLQSLERTPPKLFIFFSSVAVYGEMNYSSAINEESELNPISTYAITKYMAEQICLKSVEIVTVVARFPVIYNLNNLKDIKKRILKYGGLAFQLGDGNQRSTFCQFSTVKEQILFLLDKGFSENIVLQMGDDFTYSQNEIITLFKGQIRYRIWINRIIAKCLFGASAFIIRRKKKIIWSVYWKLFENNVYSIDKLKSIGYIPRTKPLK